MSLPEPNSDSKPSDNALARMGVEKGLAESMPSLAEMFSLEGIETALATSGYSVQEQLEDLIDIARNGAKPSDRMRAMREARELIRDVLALYQTEMTVTRKQEYTDGSGNRVTEIASFSKRFQDRPAPSSLVDTDFEVRDAD